MKRIVLTVIGVPLTLGGLVAVGFSIAFFIKNTDGVMISTAALGQYLPWYFGPGIIAIALGLTLLTFRWHA